MLDPELRASSENTDTANVGRETSPLGRAAIDSPSNKGSSSSPSSPPAPTMEMQLLRHIQNSNKNLTVLSLHGMGLAQVQWHLLIPTISHSLQWLDLSGNAFTTLEDLFFTADQAGPFGVGPPLDLPLAVGTTSGAVPNSSNTTNRSSSEAYPSSRLIPGSPSHLTEAGDSSSQIEPSVEPPPKRANTGIPSSSGSRSPFGKNANSNKDTATGGGAGGGVPGQYGVMRMQIWSSKQEAMSTQQRRLLVRHSKVHSSGGQGSSAGGHRLSRGSTGSPALQISTVSAGGDTSSQQATTTTTTAFKHLWYLNLSNNPFLERLPHFAVFIPGLGSLKVQSCPMLQPDHLIQSLRGLILGSIDLGVSPSSSAAGGKGMTNENKEELQEPTGGFIRSPNITAATPQVSKKALVEATLGLLSIDGSSAVRLCEMEHWKKGEVHRLSLKRKYIGHKNLDSLNTCLREIELKEAPIDGHSRAAAEYLTRQFAASWQLERSAVKTEAAGGFSFGLSTKGVDLLQPGLVGARKKRLEEAKRQQDEQRPLHERIDLYTSAHSLQQFSNKSLPTSSSIPEPENSSGSVLELFESQTPLFIRLLERLQSERTLITSLFCGWRWGCALKDRNVDGKEGKERAVVAEIQNTSTSFLQTAAAKLPTTVTPADFLVITDEDVKLVMRILLSELVRSSVVQQQDKSALEALPEAIIQWPLYVQTYVFRKAFQLLVSDEPHPLTEPRGKALLSGLKERHGATSSRKGRVSLSDEEREQFMVFVERLETAFGDNQQTPQLLEEGSTTNKQELLSTDPSVVAKEQQQQQGSKFRSEFFSKVKALKPKTALTMHHSVPYDGMGNLGGEVIPPVRTPGTPQLVDRKKTSDQVISSGYGQSPSKSSKKTGSGSTSAFRAGSVSFEETISQILQSDLNALAAANEAEELKVRGAKSQQNLMEEENKTQDTKVAHQTEKDSVVEEEGINGPHLSYQFLPKSNSSFITRTKLSTPNPGSRRSFKPAQHLLDDQEAEASHDDSNGRYQMLKYNSSMAGNGAGQVTAGTSLVSSGVSAEAARVGGHNKAGIQIGHTIVLGQQHSQDIDSDQTEPACSFVVREMLSSGDVLLIGTGKRQLTLPLSDLLAAIPVRSASGSFTSVWSLPFIELDYLEQEGSSSVRGSPSRFQLSLNRPATTTTPTFSSSGLHSTAEGQGNPFTDWGFAAENGSRPVSRMTIAADSHQQQHLPTTPDVIGPVRLVHSPQRQNRSLSPGKSRGQTGGEKKKLLGIKPSPSILDFLKKTGKHPDQRTRQRLLEMPAELQKLEVNTPAKHEENNAAGVSSGLKTTTSPSSGEHTMATEPVTEAVPTTDQLRSGWTAAEEQRLAHLLELSTVSARRALALTSNLMGSTTPAGGAVYRAVLSVALSQPATPLTMMTEEGKKSDTPSSTSESNTSATTMVTMPGMLPSEHELLERIRAKYHQKQLLTADSTNVEQEDTKPLEEEEPQTAETDQQQQVPVSTLTTTTTAGLDMDNTTSTQPNSTLRPISGRVSRPNSRERGDGGTPKTTTKTPSSRPGSGFASRPMSGFRAQSGSRVSSAASNASRSSTGGMQTRSASQFRVIEGGNPHPFTIDADEELIRRRENHILKSAVEEVQVNITQNGVLGLGGESIVSAEKKEKRKACSATLRRMRGSTKDNHAGQFLPAAVRQHVVTQRSEKNRPGSALV